MMLPAGEPAPLRMKPGESPRYRLQSRLESRKGRSAMPITVTAVVFQRDDLWIAQCLEYDIVSFAKTVDDLRRELMGQLEAVVVLDRKEGLAPFTGFKRAPEKYWRMYEGL